MRIFLAGATGAIGRLLVPLLLAEGHQVTALTRQDPSAIHGATAVIGDVYDATRLREVPATWPTRTTAAGEWSRRWRNWRRSPPRRRSGWCCGTGCCTAPAPGTRRAPLMADLAAAGALPAGPEITSFLHVEDAAIAAVQALHWPSGAVNIVDDEPAPASTWAPVFAQAVGAPTPSITDGTRPGWARGASNLHARTQLVWTPTQPTWRSGFAS
ncbi:NAD(P)H-binding protein [Kribbella sp. NPDC050124]|uniref:NAD(P)H-binding protein n=1 Tax=Kribbella sp. NPDC050124 TaxID=3364114 RepID=UPI00378BA46D